MATWTQLPDSLRTLAADLPNAVLLETACFDEQNRYSYLFLNPAEVFAADSAADPPALFAWMEESQRRGLYLAGYFGYECGYFLGDQAKRFASLSQSSDSMPIAWFGAYREPFIFDHASGTFLGDIPPKAASPQPAEVFAGNAELEIAEDEYARKILAIKRYIEAGDTYQVNLTDSVAVPAQHSPAVAFATLAEAQPVAYSALMHVAGQHILSLSPELFFRVKDGHIVTKPMKGTMPRGLDAATDEAQSACLRADEKNRSEHVMIVDLLRNDLGRICRSGSVQVDELFSVERYRTLLQMTSTISGELRSEVTIGEIFHALFPSGSITGAPKIRTMEIIRELERQPRGIYTGAIGYIAPNGDAVFNVAIRTLVLRDGMAKMGVGGGIVADSDAASEYRECQLKSSFLTRGTPRFQLIETMLLDAGVIPFLPLHLERIESSAAYFDFAFDRARLEEKLAELRNSLLHDSRYRVRFLLDAHGAMTMTHTPLAEESTPLKVCISPHRIQAESVWQRHKTTQREFYDCELSRARQEGFDEVLFLNEKGEMVEGAISSLFVLLKGRLITPPLASGALPGVLRRSVLAAYPDTEERALSLDDLKAADAIYLGNSVRGLRPVGRIEMESSGESPILLENKAFERFTGLNPAALSKIAANIK